MPALSHPSGPLLSRQSGAGDGVPRRRPGSRNALALAAAALLGVSCDFGSPDGAFTLTGRLGSAFDCMVIHSEGRTYELASWRDPVPPLGSYVTLRVRRLHGMASVCMVGDMVEVLRVRHVVTDFRTRPVTGAETWDRSQLIVLGKVEVTPGATLTILPGATVHVTEYGELRVRGTMRMVGTAAESIRVSGSGGGVVLDSAAAGTRVAYASLGGLTVRRTGLRIEHVRALGMRVEKGSVDLEACKMLGFSADGARVTARGSELGGTDGLFSEFEVRESSLGSLMLSYSSATVVDSRFVDGRFIVFHGASGGRFERNAFDFAETEILVRHGLTPVFSQNGFFSPSTRVVCESYQLGTCIRMTGNWWGTADAGEIARRFSEGCPVCYDPWLREPPRRAMP